MGQFEKKNIVHQSAFKWDNLEIVSSKKLRVKYFKPRLIVLTRSIPWILLLLKYSGFFFFHFVRFDFSLRSRVKENDIFSLGVLAH